MVLDNDTNIFDKRLIVLFLLKETASKLTLEQIVTLCVDFEDITYIDIYTFIESLLKSGYVKEKIQDNKKYYELTEDGEDVLNELFVLVPGVNWLNIKKMIKGQMNDYNKQYEVGTKFILLGGDEVKVSCYIKDNSDELINLTIYAGNKDNAKKISEKWKQNSDEIYKKIIGLIS